MQFTQLKCPPGELAKRWLFETIRTAIHKGDIQPGQMLPSSRQIAKYTGISRASATRAYADLQAMGYTHIAHGLGTFAGRMNDLVLDLKPDSIELDDLADIPMALLNSPVKKCLYEGKDTYPSRLTATHFGSLPGDLLPIREWQKLTIGLAKSSPVSYFDYQGDPFGFPPLRHALAEFLRYFRGIQCTASNIIVFHDPLYAFDLIASCFIDKGDIVAIENPSFPYVRNSFSLSEAHILPVEVDEEGMVIENIERLKVKPKLIYTAPAHQDPTGIRMSTERKQMLLALAQNHPLMIIEDDYGSEFQYGQSSPGSLFGAGNSPNIIYIGHFHKTLFPLVNLGYMILPDILVEAVKLSRLHGKLHLNGPVTMSETQVLTSFITDGSYSRHLKLVKSACAGRYRALLGDLCKHLSDLASWQRNPAGTDIRITFASHLSCRSIEASAAACGLMLVNTRAYYMQQPSENEHREYILSFSHFDPDNNKYSIEGFAELLKHSI